MFNMKINYLENMGKGGSNVEVRMIEFKDEKDCNGSNVLVNGYLSRIKYSEDYSELCATFFLDFSDAILSPENYAIADILDYEMFYGSLYIDRLFNAGDNFINNYRSITGLDNMWTGIFFVVNNDTNQMTRLGSCEIIFPSQYLSMFKINVTLDSTEARNYFYQVQNNDRCTFVCDCTFPIYKGEVEIVQKSMKL